MNATLLSVLSILFLATISHAQRCGSNCNFRLCRSNEFLAPINVGAKVRMGAAGVVSTPFICSLSETLTKVVTGEPMIETDAGFVPMKSWTAPSTPFPKKFYFAKTIPSFGGRRGITFKTPTAEQWALLDTKCVILPVVKTDAGRLPKDPDNCVSFRTQNPMIRITASWNSDDNINMRVAEPDTEVVSAGSPSRGGVHAGDFNLDACGKVSIGKELVTYRNECMPGEYCVRLRMKKKCMPNRTKYSISVAIRGVEFTATSGSTTTKKGDFEKFCFTIPASMCA